MPKRSVSPSSLVACAGIITTGLVAIFADASTAFTLGVLTGVATFIVCLGE